MAISIRNTTTNKIVATTAKRVHKPAAKRTAAITPAIWASWNEYTALETLAETRRSEQVSYWNGQAEIHFLNGLGVIDQTCVYVTLQYAEAQNCWDNAALWMNASIADINAEYEMQMAPAAKQSIVSRIFNIVR